MSSAEIVAIPTILFLMFGLAYLCHHYEEAVHRLKMQLSCERAKNAKAFETIEHLFDELDAIDARASAPAKKDPVQ
jgi:hypothetical protein